MATRFYFNEAEAAAVSPTISAAWSHINTERRRLQATTPDSSALSTVAYTPDAADHLVAGNAHHRQYVSDPLAAQQISGNVKAQFQCSEANAGNNLRITVKIFICSQDGTTIKEDVLTLTQDPTTEVGTALANRTFSSIAISTVDVEANDRIVVEVGLGGTPTAAGGTQGHNGSIRWGGSAAGGDLAENDTETGTTFRPWIEFDDTIAFPAVNTDITPGVGSVAVTGQAPSALLQPTGLLKDTFTRADGTAAPEWTVVPTFTAATISSNTLIGPGAASIMRWGRGGFTRTDGTALATIAGVPSAGNTLTIGVRLGSDANTRYTMRAIVVTGTNNDTIQLDRGAGVVLVGPRSEGFDWAVGDMLAIRATGSLIEAWYKRTSGVWTLFAGVTDTTFPNAGDAFLGFLSDGAWDDFSGGDPTIIPPVGSATLTGQVAVVGAGVVTGVGAVTLTGQTPVTGLGVVPVAGAVDLTGHAPTVEQSGGAANTNITPAVGSVTLTGHAPTLVTDTRVTPAVGAVTLEGAAPALLHDARVTPAVGAVTVTGHAPALLHDTRVTPTAGAVALTGHAPTVTVPGATSITPDAGAVTLTGHAPTLRIDVRITPDVGAAVLTGHAPTVSVSGGETTITPAVGAVALTGHAPTVAVPTSITPGTGAVTVTGAAPSVNQTTPSTPGVGSLAVVGQAPVVRQNIFITPGVGEVAVTGAPPLFIPILTPGSGTLTLTGHRPSLFISHAPLVDPDNARWTPRWRRHTVPSAAPGVGPGAQVSKVPAHRPASVRGGQAAIYPRRKL